MTTFIDDDGGYLAWVAANPDGYVVNCNRTPTPDYLKLHRASCKFISTSTRSNWTTGQYIKACSREAQELQGWASDQVGGSLQPCQSCLPDRKPAPKKEPGRSDVPGRSGASRFLTVKNVVEFLAALMAVIAGIVAFIKWAL